MAIGRIKALVSVYFIRPSSNVSTLVFWNNLFWRTKFHQIPKFIIVVRSSGNRYTKVIESISYHFKGLNIECHHGFLYLLKWMNGKNLKKISIWFVRQFKFDSIQFNIFSLSINRIKNCIEFWVKRLTKGVIPSPTIIWRAFFMWETVFKQKSRRESLHYSHNTDIHTHMIIRKSVFGFHSSACGKGGLYYNYRHKGTRELLQILG